MCSDGVMGGREGVLLLLLLPHLLLGQEGREQEGLGEEQIPEERGQEDQEPGMRTAST